MLYCFLDTNIFQQFQMFDQIDWLAELGADEVCLMIPRAVISELDDHKNNPLRKRLRNRAREVGPKIEEYAESVDPDQDAPIRPNTYLRVLMNNPPREWLTEHNFNPDSVDDLVVASARFFQDEHPDATVLLIADDTGPRLKARTVGIEYRKLATNLRLPEESDPQQQEINELRRENERLRNRRPDLDLNFVYQGNASDKIELAIPIERSIISDEGIERIVQEERRRLKYPDSNAAVHGIALQFFQTPSPSEYNRCLEQYLQDCREYLTSQSIFQIQNRCTYSLNVVLDNHGTAPAERIDIELVFPEFVLLRPEPLPKPSPPAPPERPQIALGIEPVSSFQGYSEYVLPPVRSSTEHLMDYLDEKTQRASGPSLSANKVLYSLDYLKQHDSWQWEQPFYLVLDVLQDLPEAFPVNVKITSASLPDPIEPKPLIRLKETQ